MKKLIIVIICFFIPTYAGAFSINFEPLNKLYDLTKTPKELITPDLSLENIKVYIVHKAYIPGTDDLYQPLPKIIRSGSSFGGSSFGGVTVQPNFTIKSNYTVSGRLINNSKTHDLASCRIKVLAIDCNGESNCITVGEGYTEESVRVPAGQVRDFEYVIHFNNQKYTEEFNVKGQLSWKTEIMDISAYEK
jgi:hypothetical protein